MASDSKLILRQHLDNGEQRVFEITLSHSHHTLIYGIYANGRCSHQKDELEVRQWDENRSECAALLCRSTISENNILLLILSSYTAKMRVPGIPFLAYFGTVSWY